MTKLNVNFNYNAWDEYLEWKKEDKKLQRKSMVSLEIVNAIHSLEKENLSL